MSQQDDSPPYGWQSDLPTFYSTNSDHICQRLRHFVRDAGIAQHEAWRTHVPTLQRECRELAERDALAAHYNAILEYQLPYDLRRSDLIILERAAVVVAELKGYRNASQGAIDQVLGYVRDLRAYHAACANRPVIPVLITAAASRPPSILDGVHVCQPRDFDSVLADIAKQHPGERTRVEDFVAPGAYVPLPTIVQAAPGSSPRNCARPVSATVC